MNPATDLESQKSALRKHLRAAISALNSEARHNASEQLRTRLEAQSAWQNAHTILFYAPMADEPDIWHLLAVTVKAGKIAALPQYSSATNTYIARQVRDIDQDIQSGQFGIREPKLSCPEVVLNKLDLTLVPGIGFDVNGSRLGRGKGYYDRLLTVVSGLKCGVAFDPQIVAHLPTAPHDVRLNCILTPTRWIET